jgi:replicative DNA helicase
MNINIILLKLFLNKDYFTKYSKIINLDYFKNNNKELFKIFLTLFELHKTSEDSLTTNDLALAFYTNYPLTKDDERVIIDATLEQVDNVEVDEERALEYLNKHNIQTVSTQIAIKALEVSQGKADIETVRELLDSLEEVREESPEDLFVSDDLEVLVNDVMEAQGLRWRLTTLNKMLGSLRKGDFGFIFARPETGKTTILASEVTYMAEQARGNGLGPVLWLNNEEQGSKVMLRCYQAAFGITQQELYTNLPHYKEKYNAIFGNHIKIYDNARITKQDVERICKEINPSLIICDQIDKIAWPDGERYDLKMKAIYQWGRELAKTYGAFIGVCQAGGTAEGKKYLNMNDVDSSHTAKQGEADFMIGIGKTNNDGEELIRFLSICKNKLAGDTDTMPDLRHGKMPVVIQPEIARYADSVTWG